MFGHHHGHEGRWRGRGNVCDRLEAGFRLGPRGFGRASGGGRDGFGGRFGGDRFGGGGRIFGPGDLRLLLLALIAEKPSHGYELIRAIEEKFGGSYAPSPGAVYPTLTLLEEQDLVRSEASEGTKKVFSVTPEGRAFLDQNAAAVRGVLARFDLSAEAVGGANAREVLRESMHTLRHALKMQRDWSPAEVDRIRRLIEATAREIVVGRGGGSGRDGDAGSST